MLSRTSIPGRSHSAFQKREANWSPRPEVIVFGGPWCFRTLCRKNSARSSEEQVDLLGTIIACVDVQLARNSSPVRGRARGRVRVRVCGGVRSGVYGGACGGVHRRGQGAGPTTEIAVLFRMLLGADTAVVGVDAIVALMGGVYCRQDGYLVRRDSCFHHNSG